MPLLSLVLAMQLHSSAFLPGGTIPKFAAARECGGSNRSPELHWSDAPAGTKRFALVIPAATASLAPGTTAFAANGAALDAKHVLDRIKGHVLGRATLRGYFGTTSTR